MSDHDREREKVARQYARAVRAPAPGPCCGGPGKGTAIRFAGYAEEELRGLPTESVVNAFGCGNPLGFGDVRRGDVVLDLGSGAGIDLLIAARAVGPEGRVIGVDMTEAMVAAARRAVREAGAANVEVRHGIIEQLPVADASVDQVISNCVINLSPEKDRVFAEIARVLKPGGRMRISDLMVEGMPDQLRDDERLRASCLAGALGIDEYREGLRRAGLVQVRVAERLVYDAAQLEAIAGARIAAALDGEVSSAMIVARKPGPAQGAGH